MVDVEGLTKFIIARAKDFDFKIHEKSAAHYAQRIAGTGKSRAKIIEIFKKFFETHEFFPTCDQVIDALAPSAPSLDAADSRCVLCNDLGTVLAKLKKVRPMSFFTKIAKVGESPAWLQNHEEIYSVGKDFRFKCTCKAGKEVATFVDQWTNEKLEFFELKK